MLPSLLWEGLGEGQGGGAVGRIAVCCNFTLPLSPSHCIDRSQGLQVFGDMGNKFFFTNGHLQDRFP